MQDYKQKPKLLTIVGPTASGKTELSIDLARKFNGEIVSADSRQIYRGMDLGTAKPKLTNGIPHHLIDIKNPPESYTVAEYKQDALRAIYGILRRKKLPILVGGTGLYIQAITANLQLPGIKAKPELRRKLEKEIEKYGIKYVFDKLVKLDPEAAYIVAPQNPRRVIRALEVALLTKKPFSAQRKKGAPLFEVLKIGIAIPKEKLRKRINQRVDKMIKNGLIEEVKNLVKKYGPAQPAFDAIGYREIIDCLTAAKRGLKTRLNAEELRANPRSNQQETERLLKEAVELIKKNTWHYAKRQLTWFKKDKEIKWIKTKKQAFLLAKEFLD